MSAELPKGWASIKLEDHVYIAGRIGWRGLKRSEYANSGPLFLAVKNILPNGEIDFTETDHLSKERYDESPEIQLNVNDILLTKDGTIGKVAMVQTLPASTTVNSSILVVRPKDRLLLARYLFHFLRGPQFQTIAHERITGSAIPHLFQKDIKQLQALVPPLSEQRRIVAKLEKLLDKVDACQKRLEKIPVILKRFRQSVLAAACSGRLTEDWRENNDPNKTEIINSDLPEKWRYGRLSDLCESIADGDHQPPPKQNQGIPFLVIGNVSSGVLDFTQTRFVSQKYFEKIKPERKPKIGDILYTVVGATIGIPVIVDTNRSFCFQRHIALLRPSEHTTTGFLQIVMRTKDLYRQAWESVTGTAQPTLPLGNLRKLLVPIAPFAEQKEIVRRVEALFKIADQIEARYQKAQAHVDKLNQSILAKAFRGELVPQDPDDEPADVLLERIRMDAN